jgi:murein endopeptidase
MQPANAKASATAVAACATGQREAIGSYCNRICGGANATPSAATAPEYQPMQSHRLLLHLQMQWVNEKSPAVAAGVSGTGKCESIGR